MMFIINVLTLERVDIEVSCSYPRLLLNFEIHFMKVRIFLTD